jgi:predicted acetyltransferase
MDAMQLLHTRYSALTLGEPAPSFAQGLGAMWRTGDAAYDITVKNAFAIEVDDLIVGFIYVGTEIGNAAARAPRSVDEFTAHWTGRRGTASAT